MAKNTTIILIIAAVVILLILGYVWMNKTPTTPTNNNPQKQNTAEVTKNIEITNNAFFPDTLTIKVGETIVWTNKDSAKHTVTSDTGAELSSQMLSTGNTFSHTFNTAGTFAYHCEVHPSMKATIIVE